jgi:hypothetical protein
VSDTIVEVQLKFTNSGVQGMSFIDTPCTRRSWYSSLGRLVLRPTAVLNILITPTLAAGLPRTGHTEVAVLTRSYDNERTGANTREIVLTPERVMRGLRITQQLRVDPDDDPHLEAQPLYVPKLEMSDRKLHNVLYVFTLANSIYAFDVDTGETLWKIRQSLGPPSHQTSYQTQFVLVERKSTSGERMIVGGSSVHR